MKEKKKINLEPLGFIVFGLVLSGLITLTIFSIRDWSTKAQQYCCTYEAVVRQGDNVTQILQRYSFVGESEGSFNINHVISVVKDLNDWDRTPTLHPRDVIVIPIYCGECCERR